MEMVFAIENISQNKKKKKEKEMLPYLFYQTSITQKNPRLPSKETVDL